MSSSCSVNDLLFGMMTVSEILGIVPRGKPWRRIMNEERIMLRDRAWS